MEELRVINTVADPGFRGGWRGPSGAGVGGHTDAVLTNSSHMLMLGTYACDESEIDRSQGWIPAP